MELARKHHLRVLGLLLAPPAYISTCPTGPDPGRCAVADTREFGRLAGEIAEHAQDTIRHWEILNEPDADWAFTGTPEQYAAMLSAAHDGIKGRVPDARLVLGGIQRADKLDWLERVFATPGTDAIHKFDIANVHLRGPVAPVVNRYQQFRAWLGDRGFKGPLWITELGYPADPAYQVDPSFTDGDAGQAAYLTQSLVDLGEAGAKQVFVTLRDGGEGAYASEGLVHMDEAPGGATTRRDVVLRGQAARDKLGSADGLAPRAAQERAGRPAVRGGGRLRGGTPRRAVLAQRVPRLTTLSRAADRDARAALSGLARRKRLRGRLVEDQLVLQRAADALQLLVQLVPHTMRLALDVAHPAAHALDLLLELEHALDARQVHPELARELLDPAQALDVVL